MAPRERTNKNSDLRDFPGLGRYKDGRFYLKHPYTGKMVSVKTRDKSQAIMVWANAQVVWRKEQSAVKQQHLQQSLADAAIPKSTGDNIHLADYIRKWRLDVLGYDKVDGQIKLQPTKVKIVNKRNRGKPIDARTQRDYGGYTWQLERSPAACFPLATKDAKDIRKLLAPWMEKPAHYNHLKAVLSRVYQHAVASGVCSQNPIKDIDPLPTSDREVTVPDDAYQLICSHLMTHKLNRRTHDGEWRVRIIDLMFFMSQQPVDVFSLTESQIDLDAGEFGEIHITRQKTKNAGVIEMNADMRETVDWLLAFKRAQLSKIGKVVMLQRPEHLLIYPAYFGRRSRWKPVQHRTMRDYWREACKAVGLPLQYRLTDLRKTGLTLEFANQGKNDKGIHDNEAMAMRYVVRKPPKRSKNTLTQLRKTDASQNK